MCVWTVGPRLASMEVGLGLAGPIAGGWVAGLSTGTYRLLVCTHVPCFQWGRVGAHYGD